MGIASSVCGGSSRQMPHDPSQTDALRPKLALLPGEASSSQARASGTQYVSGSYPNGGLDRLASNGEEHLLKFQNSSLFDAARASQLAAELEEERALAEMPLFSSFSLKPASLHKKSSEPKLSAAAPGVDPAGSDPLAGLGQPVLDRSDTFSVPEEPSPASAAAPADTARPGAAPEAAAPPAAPELSAAPEPSVHPAPAEADATRLRADGDAGPERAAPPEPEPAELPQPEQPEQPECALCGGTDGGSCARDAWWASDGAAPAAATATGTAEAAASPPHSLPAAAGAEAGLGSAAEAEAGGEPAAAGAEGEREAEWWAGLSAERTAQEREWERRLSPLLFRVLRQGRTEPQGSGECLLEQREGEYRCAGCSAPLYASQHKLSSGAAHGWPAFGAGLEAVGRQRQGKGAKMELVCSGCGGHLGHVFSSKRYASGERHCVNSASLAFIPAAERDAAHPQA